MDRYQKAYIPYGGYYSTPFCRWQGRMQAVRPGASIASVPRRSPWTVTAASLSRRGTGPNNKRKERKMKRYVVNESEGVRGKLPVPGGGGTFNILIDEEISGAQHFSLLVNEMTAGYKGKEHSHRVEHCWYILSGTGIIRMAGQTFHIKPGDAIFAPIGMAHSVECTGNEPLRYVVVYAPPGPEKELRSQTGFAKRDFSPSKA